MSYLTINLETEEFFINWGEEDSLKPTNYVKIADTLGKLNAGGFYFEQVKYAIMNYGIENVEDEMARAEQLLEWMGAFTYKYTEGKCPDCECDSGCELESEPQQDGAVDKVFVQPDQSFEGIEEDGDL